MHLGNDEIVNNGEIIIQSWKPYQTINTKKIISDRWWSSPVDNTSQHWKHHGRVTKETNLMLILPCPTKRLEIKNYII